MLILVFSLSGCGFHLRGADEFSSSLEVLHLTVRNVHGDLHQKLIRSFEQSGTSVIADSDGTGPGLNVSAERNTRRAVATTSTISVSEYELGLEVDIELSDRDGQMLIPETTLKTERIYTFDASSLTGSSEEEALLREEMQEDMVRQIIRRVNATMNSIKMVKNS